MENLKIDKTKCFTPHNYSKNRRIPLSTVYHHIKHKKVPTVEIDGVTFIYEG